MIPTYIILQVQKFNFLEKDTLKTRYNESRFNEIPQFSEQMSAPLNYFIILNEIRFSELHNLVNKSDLMDLIC